LSRSGLAAEIELLSFEDARPDTVATFRTHDQLARYGIDLTVDSLFADFSFSRPWPLWITPAEGQPVNHWFEESAARALFDKGYIVREAPDKDTADARIWAVRYRFDRFSLSLSEAARHKFLGKIWVHRHLDASILVHVWDIQSGELLWSNTSSQRFSDWVPKGELRSLADVSPPLTAPEPPTTTAERLTEPILVATAIGALTILFFAVR
jgi:hypothetical protein